MDFQRANDIIKKVKELQKKQKIQNDSLENLDDSQQENIQLNKGKRPVMNDVKIRPNLTGKKMGGQLEGHLNGLRYTTSNKQEKVDILYRNVKHAFLIVLVHFHLKQEILVGKKKSKDVQFYIEAGVMTEDLDIRGRGRQQDQDEYEQEQREKLQRKKLNQEFEQFVKALDVITKDYFQFDVPYKQLGFYGTPQRSQVFLKPTVNCLVNLSETPFFVLTLDEIELAYFERVQFGLKNFDLAFVFKNYDLPVIRISAIPVESIDSLKNWLEYIINIYIYISYHHDLISYHIITILYHIISSRSYIIFTILLSFIARWIFSTLKEL